MILIRTCRQVVSKGELAFGQRGEVYVSGRNELYREDQDGKPAHFAALRRPFTAGLFRGHANMRRGLCVRPEGDIFCIHHYNAHGNGSSQITQIWLDGQFRQVGVINAPRVAAAGIQADLEGNLHVGMSVRPAANLLPPDTAKYGKKVRAVSVGGATGAAPLASPPKRRPQRARNGG